MIIDLGCEEEANDGVDDDDSSWYDQLGIKVSKPVIS